MDKQIKKIKMIYSIEFLAIALVFLVIGLLELFKIMSFSERFQLIFKIITLAGAAWIFFDFFWTLYSPKKRKKNSLLDKILLLPAAIYIVVFDIVGFTTNRPYEYYQIGIPLLFFYIACIYIFEGIYHYYKPVPMVEEMINDAIKEQQEKQKSNSVEENKEDNSLEKEEEK